MNNISFPQATGWLNGEEASPLIPQEELIVVDSLIKEELLQNYEQLITMTSSCYENSKHKSLNDALIQLEGARKSILTYSDL